MSAAAAAVAACMQITNPGVVQLQSCDSKEGGGGQWRVLVTGTS